MWHVHASENLGHGRLKLVRLVLDGGLPLALIFEQSLETFIDDAVEIEPTTSNADGVAGLDAALDFAALAFLT